MFDELIDLSVDRLHDAILRPRPHSGRTMAGFHIVAGAVFMAEGNERIIVFVPEFRDVMRIRNGVMKCLRVYYDLSAVANRIDEIVVVIDWRPIYIKFGLPNRLRDFKGDSVITHFMEEYTDRRCDCNGVVHDWATRFNMHYASPDHIPPYPLRS